MAWVDVKQPCAGFLSGQCSGGFYFLLATPYSLLAAAVCPTFASQPFRRPGEGGVPGFQTGPWPLSGEDSINADQVLRVIGRCGPQIGQRKVADAVSAVNGTEQHKERLVRIKCQNSAVSGKIV